MSANKYLPHILILPEDEANGQLANGFVVGLPRGRIQILPEAGGWPNVLRLFKEQHIRGLETYPARHIVLLIDFDDFDDLVTDRFQHFQSNIPDQFRDKVFVLGIRSEPESLKKSLKQESRSLTFEAIGIALVEECRRRERVLWLHDQLRHNIEEITRLSSAFPDLLT